MDFGADMMGRDVVHKSLSVVLLEESRARRTWPCSLATRLNSVGKIVATRRVDLSGQVGGT